MSLYLKEIPVLSEYARTRGWPFVVAWIHRVTGLILVFYVWYHIYTLSLLKAPAEYNAKMNFFGFFIFVVLEWLLAAPVIFHALNGGRLILYEVFQNRNDESMMRWVFSLSITYVLLLGLFMVMGNQSVSPLLFWLLTLLVSVCLIYLTATKLRKSGASFAWKLQRITGVFLLIVIPAHLLFMHLEPSLGHDSNVVILRMQNVFIKVFDLVLVLGVLYHGGYGLLSIVKDYFSSKLLQYFCSLIIITLMTVFGWIGVKLTVFI